MTAALSPGARVAVIGAGLAGAACAQALKARGFRVEVFEKSRGVGGRLAVRRPFGRDDPVGIDHGAPYAQARAPEKHPEAAAALATLGATWEAPGVPEGALLGTPGMSDLVRPLLEGATLRAGVEVKAIARGPEDYLLIDAEGAQAGPFAAVAVAAPAPQAVALLGDASHDADKARMTPGWTLIYAFDGVLAADAPPVLHPEDGVVGVMVRNSAKPGRAPLDAKGRTIETWVVHFTADYAAARLEESKEEFAAAHRDSLFERLGLPARADVYLAAHRWRYARTKTPIGAPHWLSEDGRLGCCGDWRLGHLAGDALRSGLSLGRALGAVAG